MTGEGHTNGINSVAFSPNGHHALSGSVDETVRLWDVADGRLRRSLPGHIKPVEHVRFSPDGSLLVSAGADGIRLWDVRSATCMLTLT